MNVLLLSDEESDTPFLFLCLRKLKIVTDHTTHVTTIFFVAMLWQVRVQS